MVQAIADYRGTFEQGSRTTLFLKITDFQGDAVDPSAIAIAIEDMDGDEVDSGTPEKITNGFYIFDWNISSSQAVGEYTVTWTYDLDEDNVTTVQTVIVAGDGEVGAASQYSDMIAGLRASLDMHLGCAQAIPVHDEQGSVCDDMQTVRFTFNKWNQNKFTRIYRNQKEVTSGVTINYFKGEVIFDEPLTDFDTVNGSYNFRWFSDTELDRFLQNAVHILNVYPPATRVSLQTLGSGDNLKYIPLVLYGAAKDAIRELLMCLQFQQPQEVFGGPDAARQAFQNLETLKKNYEGDFNLLLEQKKYGSYVGLTKTVVTPEYTLPGGRSRWFRYLMGGFSL